MANAGDIQDLSEQMTLITDVVFTQGDIHGTIIQECCDQLKAAEEKAKKSSADSNQTKCIEAVGKAMNEAVNIVHAIKEGDLAKGLQSGTSMVQSGTGLVLSGAALLKSSTTLLKSIDSTALLKSGMALIKGLASLAGPLGAAVNAVCTVLSTIFGMAFSKKEESLLSQMRRVIKEELQEFKIEQLQDKGAGLEELGKVLTDELQSNLREIRETGDTTYSGFNPARLDDLYKFIGELKRVAKGKMSLLSEESTDKTIEGENPTLQTLESYTKLLTDKNKKERESLAKDCLTCLQGYANIATLCITLLTLHKTLSRQVKRPEAVIKCLDEKLETLRDDGEKLFSFFSDVDMLGPAGWWKGKLRVMEECRKKPKILASIERFQQLIDMSPAKYSIDEASYALNLCLVLRAHRTIYPLEPSFSRPDAGDEYFDRNENHYFCLVNNTSWPVCVFSGLEATNLNVLKFKQEVSPNDYFVHPCADLKKSDSNFSSSGLFVIGENLKELGQMRNVQYIEFALSNPYWIPAGAFRKKILTQPVDFYDKAHLKCTYNDGLQDPYDRAKSFTYNGQFCLVKGELKRGRDHGKDYTLYRFFIEEFDDEKLKRESDKQFVAFMRKKYSLGSPPEHFASKFDVDSRDCLLYQWMMKIKLHPYAAMALASFPRAALSNPDDFKDLI